MLIDLLRNTKSESDFFVTKNLKNKSLKPVLKIKLYKIRIQILVQHQIFDNTNNIQI